MKTYAALLPLVTLSCLLLVAPAMAGPIQLQSNAPSGTDSASGVITTLGYPGPDFLSILHSSAPSGFGLSASMDYPSLNNSLGSDKMIGAGGGPPDPPTPAPISEPSGIMVMFGSGVFGVLGVWRRRLRA